MNYSSGLSWNYDVGEVVSNAIVAVVVLSVRLGRLPSFEKGVGWAIQKAIINVLGSVIDYNVQALATRGQDGEYISEALLAALSTYINKGRDWLSLAEEQMLISVLAHALTIGGAEGTGYLAALWNSRPTMGKTTGG